MRDDNLKMNDACFICCRSSIECEIKIKISEQKTKT